MIELLSQPSIITAIIAFISGLSISIVPKLFERKKNNVEILEQLSQNLWKEIGRLQEQIENLKTRELQAELRENDLKEKIKILESENSKQTFKILQLEREIKELRDGKANI